MLVVRPGTHKVHVRISNRENPDQTASSDLDLHCLHRPFWQSTSVLNFKAFPVMTHVR